MIRIIIVSLVLILAGCGGGDPEPARDDAIASDATPVRATEPASNTAALHDTAPPTGTAIPSDYTGSVVQDLPPDEGPAHETERDWAIAAGTVAWAREQGLQSLPIGEVTAIIGATFVGTPYEPGTLELPGPERLVVNLRTFDCVTLVEHALVLARLARDADVDPESDTFRDRYRESLIRLRYRNAEIDGYASRLHYFTEWLDAGIDRGDFDEITDALGGLPDTRPIHFMSSNPEAYRQLNESPELIQRIADIESELSERTRLFIPQDAIADIEDRIQNGDIIAAVSTVDGLDIAHTGLALRVGDRLHLLHAPLVGDSVEVSELPLAERIQGISGQMGIRVVRPR